MLEKTTLSFFGTIGSNQKTSQDDLAQKIFDLELDFNTRIVGLQKSNSLYRLHLTTLEYKEPEVTDKEELILSIFRKLKPLVAIEVLAKIDLINFYDDVMKWSADSFGCIGEFNCYPGDFNLKMRIIDLRYIRAWIQTVDNIPMTCWEWTSKAITELKDLGVVSIPDPTEEYK